jgi:hypothetical protein
MEKLVIPSGPGYRSATRFVDVIGRVESGGTGDFVLDLAAPLPLKIIGDLIGVPECRSPSPYAPRLRGDRHPRSSRLSR